MALTSTLTCLANGFPVVFMAIRPTTIPDSLVEGILRTVVAVLIFVNIPSPGRRRRYAQAPSR